MLVDGGIADVLITNEIVGAHKVERLAALAHRAQLGVCVDDPVQVDQIGAACATTSSRIDVYIELDVGQGRCGAATAADVIALAGRITLVISTAGGRLILDAGLKSFAVDSGLPLAPDAPGWQFTKASDEHGVMVPASAAPPLPIAVGQKMRLIPGHCDPTVNLHDWYVGVRDGVVETLWPISARGAIF